MNDLISRAAAIKLIDDIDMDAEKSVYGNWYENARDGLANLPSANDIIRCKDCMNNARNCDGRMSNWCYKFGYDVYDDDFCSYGEE